MAVVALRRLVRCMKSQCDTRPTCALARRCQPEVGNRDGAATLPASSFQSHEIVCMPEASTGSATSETPLRRSLSRALLTDSLPASATNSCFIEIATGQLLPGVQRPPRLLRRRCCRPVATLSSMQQPLHKAICHVDLDAFYSQVRDATGQSCANTFEWRASTWAASPAADTRPQQSLASLDVHESC